MSSSTNSQPKIKQTQGTKAAIIRPVNRRSGKQSYVRIDDAQNAVRPNVRALQLEDYVAQIRGAAAASKVPAVAPVEEQPTAKPVPKAKSFLPKPKMAKKFTITTASPPSIVSDIARQQQSASADLTHAEHVDVLQAVAKLDSGYQWIAENNRAAAEATAEIAREIEAVVPTEIVEPEVAAPQTTTQPLSQDLVNSIATAIASVLTDTPETKLNAKIESGNSSVDSPATVSVEEETLRLSPELPRPEYTLPVSAAHSLQANETVAAKPPAQPQPIAETNSVSISASAWDVPAFRWPTVTDQILSIDQMMSSLAHNCENILSPFGKAVAVTAPTRGQGTTTMTLTLARALAARNKRVLIVDGDIMQPTLSSTIGVGGVSWYENHSSQQSVGECIVHGKASGICLMPLNAPVANVEPYSAPIFDILETQINKVRAEFDLIVIDAGPVWQIVDEISSNSHLVDAAMLVNQDTHSNGFTEARERLMDRGIFKFIAAQNAFARKAG